MCILGYNDDEDEDEEGNVCSQLVGHAYRTPLNMRNSEENKELKSFRRDELPRVEKFNHTEILTDDDENPHIHLHLLTHPHQQAMHIRCTDKVCSNCANVLASGENSAEGTQITTDKYSFNEIEWTNLRDNSDIVGCKVHGHNGKNSIRNLNAQAKCHIHGSTALGKYFFLNIDFTQYRKNLD